MIILGNNFQKQDDSSTCMRLPTLLVTLVIAAVSLLLLWRSVLDLDVAHFLALAKMVDNGRDLYDGLLDQNTPGIVSIGRGSVTLSKLTGLALDRSHLLLVSLLLFAVFSLSTRLFRKLAPNAPILCLGFGAIGAISLFLLPLPDFARREHIFTACFLPYVLAVLLHLRGVDRTRLETTAVVMAGVFGLFLKPHFSTYALALGLYELSRTGFRVSKLCRETWLIALGLSIAYATFLVMEPNYLGTVVPYVSATFLRYRAGFLSAMRSTYLPFSFASLLLVGTTIWTRWDRGNGVVASLIPLGWLFTLASCLVVGVQGFGFQYHVLPLRILIFLSGSLLCFWLADRLRTQWRDRGGRTSLAGSVSLLVLVMAVLLCPSEYREHTGFSKRSSGMRSRWVEHPFVELFNYAGAGGYVYLFCSSVRPGGWAHVYSDTRWAGHMIPMFMLPIIVDKRNDPSAYPAADAGMLREIESSIRQWVLRDFQQRTPNLVLFDTGPRKRYFRKRDFSYLAFLMEDPAFASLWHDLDYRKVGLIEDFTGRPFVAFMRGSQLSNAGAVRHLFQ